MRARVRVAVAPQGAAAAPDAQRTADMEAAAAAAMAQTDFDNPCIAIPAGPPKKHVFTIGMDGCACCTPVRQAEARTLPPFRLFCPSSLFSLSLALSLSLSLARSLCACCTPARQAEARPLPHSPSPLCVRARVCGVAMGYLHVAAVHCRGREPNNNDCTWWLTIVPDARPGAAIVQGGVGLKGKLGPQPFF